MTQTLYRKYRPQLFSEVVGQDHITKTLLNQVKSGTIAHAYLFSGPRGIGKTTTARLLAKAVNAHNPKTGEPDNESPINISITEGRSLDLVEIDAASNRRIDEVRELREHVKYPPNEAKYKVFIIDEVHMLTPEAFNALLKTLEEPPTYVIFILATTELQSLPETIISRCQRFDFKKVNPLVLESRLRNLAQQEGVVVAPAVLKTIIKLSEGCVRDAESYLGQVLSLGEKNITEKEASIFLPKSSSHALEILWQAIIDRNTNSAVSQIQELVANGFDIEHFFNEWLEFLRYLLLWKINPQNSETIFIIDQDSIESIKLTLEKISTKEINQIIQLNLQYKDFFDLTPVPQLVLELAIIESIENLKDQDNNQKDSDNDSPGDKKLESNKSDSKSTDSNLKATWVKTIEIISKQNPTLGQYLQTTNINKNKSSLDIIAGHFFHYEIIKKPVHLKIINDVLEKLLKQKIRIVVKLNEKPSVVTNNDNLIDNLANAFGGVVVPESAEE